MEATGQDLAPLASLSLTHVYYDPTDRISLLCAYLALLPQALCVVYATLILTTREVEIGLMFAGQVACEALNFGLKRLIKEERPPRIHGKGYGMPSSHAQFVVFWSVSLTLFLLFRHQPKGKSTTQGKNVDDGNKGEGQVTNKVTFEAVGHRPWSFGERLVMSVLASGLAASVAWSRIYLGYHTPKQVFVGSFAGLASAVGWFLIVAFARQTGWLAWSLELPIARLFRMRDLLVEEDLCQAGWEKWEDKRAHLAKDKEKSL